MSVIGWDYTCQDCGGDVRIVNEGFSHGHVAAAVFACVDCEQEWCPRITNARVKNVRATIPDTGQRRSGELIDVKAAEAHWLIQAGRPVAAACRTVGIDRHSYYDRYRRTA